MPQAATRFINPNVLARISSLELLSRGVVEGFIAGLHRSPYKGFSVDFMEYRPYTPGDDLQRVDWKLYARTDRTFVKEFQGETNTRLHLVLDISGSMDYTSHEITKRTYCFYLAASLAYLMIRQHDAVGLTLFDDSIRTSIPPRSSKGHLHTLLTHLEEAEPGAETAFEKPLHEIAERQHRRGFVVILSDLLSDPDALVDGLKHFRFNGHNVLVFHVLDPQEVAFEYADIVEFEDLETGERLLVEAERAGQLYRENFNQFQARLRKECALLGVDYALLTTDQPLDHALFNYLSSRAQRRT